MLVAASSPRKRLHDRRVELTAGILEQLTQGVGVVLGRTVRTVADHRHVGIDDGQDPGLPRDRLPRQTQRVAASIRALAA